MWAYWNGRIVRPTDVGLSLADAGLVYSATITDFCRTYHHRLFRWPQHLSRFRADCLACDIPLSLSDTELTQIAAELVARTAAELPPGRELALISFATPGPLGYLLGESHQGPPTLVLHTFPLNPARYQALEHGATLELVGVLPHDPNSVIPVSAKHRSRLAWWLADRRKQDAASVACLVNAQQQAPDTAIASVVLMKEGQLQRSPVGTILESVSLAVLTELAAARGVPVLHRAISWHNLAEPGVEVFLVGSGFGIAPVKELRQRGVTGATTLPIGPRFHEFQHAWQELVAAECR